MTKKSKLFAMIISIVMVCAMVFCLTACGKTPATDTPSGENGNKSGNTTTTPAAKYQAAQKTWDDATGEKSITDEFSVTITLPVGKGIFANVKGEMTRTYKGSDITKIEGKIMEVSVTGAISTALDAVGTFVDNFDLNTLIPKSEKTEDGLTRYPMKDGRYLIKDDSEEEINYYYEEGEEVSAEEFKELEENKEFTYYELANANNEVILKNKNKPLAKGELTVNRQGEFTLDGSVDLPFIQVAPEEAFEVPSDIIDMAEVKSLMAEFDVELDLDAVNLFDISSGSVKETSAGFTSTVVFATAMKSLFDQIDNLYDSFMGKDLDNTIYDVYASFADKFAEEDDKLEKIAKDDFVEYMDDARAMIKAFKKALAGETLSEMLLTLIEMDDCEIEVTGKSKISEITLTQTGTLTITNDLIMSVVGIINEQDLIEAANGDLMAWAPIESMPKMTVESIYSAVKSMLFKNGKMKIAIEVEYTGTLEY